MKNNWPDIDILIPTHERPFILKKAIECLDKNLVYNGGLKYLVGFDGDKSAAKMFSGDSRITTIDGPDSGLGANLNQLIRLSTGDFLLQMDDDHLLVGEIDLNKHVLKLERDPSVGWIKLMGIGHHDYIACLEGEYWRIWWKSPELYIPSNRPHLKHRRFHDHFGLYPEGVNLADTEIGFCRQCKKIGSGPSVLVPIGVDTEGAWEHIGESWQLRGK